MFRLSLFLAIIQFSIVSSNETNIDSIQQSFLFKKLQERYHKANKTWKGRVYLATFARSGNHWMRYLFEEATHVATSCVHLDLDPPHQNYIHPWGGYSCMNGYEGNCRYAKNGEPVVIKTHFPASDHDSPFANLPYKATIRIVRHPVDSFYSFWTYIHHEKPPSPRIPRNTLRQYINMWRVFQSHWNTQKNVLSFKYEDLLENPKFYLQQSLEIAGFTFEEKDVERAVNKYPAKGKPLKHLSKFTNEDLQYIYTELNDLMDQFGYEKRFN